ncbi:hypothetical protein [Mycolicibacterium sediminis]|nr:hypothetical protein [Mycolicibacterium sediminis]
MARPQAVQVVVERLEFQKTPLGPGSAVEQLLYWTNSRCSLPSGWNRTPR